MVHPFLLDMNLDENLELFFGLSIPFIDFKIGVQGIDETFSFIIANEGKEKSTKEASSDLGDHSGKLDQGEMLNLLKTSKIKRLQADHKISESQIVQTTSQMSKMNFINSEYWKASSYLNTVMSCQFLSTLVSIVEYAQTDITTLLQDWLNVVQFITSLGGSSSDSLTPTLGNLSSISSGGQQQPKSFEQIKMAKLLEQMENNSKPLSVSVIS